MRLRFTSNTFKNCSVFKSLNGINPPIVQELFSPKTCKYTLRSGKQLVFTLRSDYERNDGNIFTVLEDNMAEM